MNLKDIYKQIPAYFDNISSHQIDTPIDKKILELYKEKILTCDEFEKVSEIHFIEDIFLDDKLDNIIEIETISVDENTKFTGINYIYSLMQSPKVYKHYTPSEPVKDGIAISSTKYSPIDFTPSKQIVLTYKLGGQGDNIIASEDRDTLKQKLKDSIDKIFDNTHDYRVNDNFKILLRGIFNLKNPLFKSKKVRVYYTEKQTSTGYINISPKFKYIPATLRELFENRFKDKKDLTLEEIESYLKEAVINKRMSKK